MTSKPDNREVWHEDRERAFLCRCADGQHDPKFWLHTGHPSDRAQFIADHNQAQLVERLRAALERIASHGYRRGVDVSEQGYDMWLEAVEALAELREGDA